jgi:ferredoxin
MPKISFDPVGISIDVSPNTKILAAATRAKIPIRFGCGAARCGTCAIKVRGQCSTMQAPERELLERMNLDTSGPIRLACQARVDQEDIHVDLDFQDSYSPDVGIE